MVDADVIYCEGLIINMIIATLLLGFLPLLTLLVDPKQSSSVVAAQSSSAVADHELVRNGNFMMPLLDPEEKERVVQMLQGWQKRVLLGRGIDYNTAWTDPLIQVCQMRINGRNTFMTQSIKLEVGVQYIFTLQYATTLSESRSVKQKAIVRIAGQRFRLDAANKPQLKQLSYLFTAITSRALLTLLGDDDINSRSKHGIHITNIGLRKSAEAVVAGGERRHREGQGGGSRGDSQQKKVRIVRNGEFKQTYKRLWRWIGGPKEIIKVGEGKAFNPAWPDGVTVCHLRIHAKNIRLTQLIMLQEASHYHLSFSFAATFLSDHPFIQKTNVSLADLFSRQLAVEKIIKVNELEFGFVATKNEVSLSFRGVDSEMQNHPYGVHITNVKIKIVNSVQQSPPTETRMENFNYVKNGEFLEPDLGSREFKFFPQTEPLPYWDGRLTLIGYGVNYNPAWKDVNIRVSHLKVQGKYISMKQTVHLEKGHYMFSLLYAATSLLGAAAHQNGQVLINGKLLGTLQSAKEEAIHTFRQELAVASRQVLVCIKGIESEDKGQSSGIHITSISIVKINNFEGKSISGSQKERVYSEMGLERKRSFTKQKQRTVMESQVQPEQAGFKEATHSYEDPFSESEQSKRQEEAILVQPFFWNSNFVNMLSPHVFRERKSSLLGTFDRDQESNKQQQQEQKREREQWLSLNVKKERDSTSKQKQATLNSGLTFLEKKSPTINTTNKEQLQSIKRTSKRSEGGSKEGRREGRSEKESEEGSEGGTFRGPLTDDGTFRQMSGTMVSINSGKSGTFNQNSGTISGSMVSTQQDKNKTKFNYLKMIFKENNENREENRLKIYEIDRIRENWNPDYPQVMSNNIIKNSCFAQPAVKFQVDRLISGPRLQGALPWRTLNEVMHISPGAPYNQKWGYKQTAQIVLDERVFSIFQEVELMPGEYEVSLECATNRYARDPKTGKLTIESMSNFGAEARLEILSLWIAPRDEKIQFVSKRFKCIYHGNYTLRLEGSSPSDSQGVLSVSTVSLLRLEQQTATKAEMHELDQLLSGFEDLL